MYSNKLVCEILIYIDDNINNKISIEDLENRFFYNRFYMMKLFKKEIGSTILNYINSIRIYNSIIQIKENNSSFMSVALNNGFYSLEYFSEIFKQITTLNPKKYRDYFSKKKTISSDDIELINKYMIKLFDISKIKNVYLSKQKPIVNPVKKLSIFK